MPVQQVFRCSFWYLWSRLSLLSIGLVILGTSVSQFGAVGEIFNADSIWFIAVIGSGKLIITALAVFAHIRYFPVIVDEEGISAHGSSAKRRRISWSDVRGFRRGRHVGVPCYYFHSKQSDVTLIVPICLKGWSEFESVLVKRKIMETSETKLQPQTSRRPTDRESLRRSRPVIAPVREGGYIIISTEQRGLKSR
jgi:hypothetical protein